MSRSRGARTSGALLAVLLGLLPAWAAVGPGAATATPEPGQRGVMLTAVEGDRIEEIPVAYIGLRHDMIGPGYDVHLVRLEGPIAERVGVAAGMSGSPVYFDGRLLGAMAYRFGALPSEAVAGVTPIEDILRASPAPGSSPAAAGGRVAPIGTPVQVSGLSPAVRQWAGPQFEALGLIPVAGGAGGAADDRAPGLSAGSPVGVALVRGDMSIAATGTVTHVDGDRVYAFGHPFLGSGEVEMPMLTARVVHTLADLAGSVKMAEIGSEVGAVVEDRLTAIVGQTGRRARMIPLELDVRGSAYGSQTFRFEVARTGRLAPLLAAVAVANSLSSNVGYAEESTMISTGTIRLRGLPPLPVEVAAASGQGADPAIAVAVTLQQLLGSLWLNPFAEVEVESIALSVRVEPGVRQYRVEQLQYDRGPLRPGQTFAVNCVLRRYRGGTETARFEFRVPEGLPAEARLALVVGAPDQIDRALGQPLARRYRSAADLTSVVGVLGDLRAANRLTAVLFHQAPGVVSGGVAYDDLPPTARELLGADAPTAVGKSAIRLAALERAERALDGPVEGALVVRLQLDSGLQAAPGPIEAEP